MCAIKFPLAPAHFSFVAVEDVDPVQNTNALAGAEEKDLGFPFASPDATTEQVAVEERPDP